MDSFLPTQTDRKSDSPFILRRILRQFIGLVMLAMLPAHPAWAAPQTPASHGDEADLVLIEGKIITVDSQGSIAQALAVKAGRIVTAGSNSEVSNLIGKQTQVIRLEGRNVLPGLALHLVRTPRSSGKTRKEQRRIGRYDLLSTSFETFERNIREQLTRVLAEEGFDPTEDIVAITVNRWPGGYSYAYNSLYDPLEWVFTSSPNRPCVLARQPFGSITIANADAAAILEAHRAVGEILSRRAMPSLS
jgi:hypothetical protein